jgi:hypothetical protein
VTVIDVGVSVYKRTMFIYFQYPTVNTVACVRTVESASVLESVGGSGSAFVLPVGLADVVKVSIPNPVTDNLDHHHYPLPHFTLQ